MLNSLLAALSYLSILAETDVGTGLLAVGAGLAILGALGAGLGIGIATGKAVEAISRQPDAEGKIRNTLLFGIIFAETIAIYAIFVVILILFVL
ncbi:MAG: ATP synthase F0 subunit C [Clostridiales bacterium]|jgi:F-type H+-transporting ATPase subunit c|nr:ATP synthase F0 subunit C [Clostridiales bacterium]